MYVSVCVTSKQAAVQWLHSAPIRSHPTSLPVCSILHLTFVHWNTDILYSNVVKQSQQGGSKDVPLYHVMSTSISFLRKCRYYRYSISPLPCMACMSVCSKFNDKGSLHLKKQGALALHAGQVRPGESAQEQIGSALPSWTYVPVQVS